MLEGGRVIRGRMRGERFYILCVYVYQRRQFLRLLLSDGDDSFEKEKDKMWIESVSD